MRSKMLAVLAAVVLVGADARGQDGTAKEVEQAIQALNEAFKDRDAVAINRLMANDHLSVTSYYGGPQTKEQQLKSLPELKLTEYKAGKLTVTLLGKDAALVTYPLEQKGTFQGKAVPAKSFASAVWVRRDGKWLEAFYQETALEGK